MRYNCQYSHISQSTMEQEIAQIEELYSRIPQQLIAHLSTTLQAYTLPHSTLELSSDLDEEALNQLLRDLLQISDLPRFEFIVQGHLLRGKLKSHILRYELTAEQTLTIQYVLSFPQLENHTKAPEDDWVSAVVAIAGPEGTAAVAAALYSGVVSVYNPKLVGLGKFSADSEPLKALQFIPSTNQNSYYCLTGGLGETLKVNLVKLDGGNLESQLVSSNEHSGTITSIAVSPGAQAHIATSGSSGDLNIWQIPENFDETAKSNLLKNKKKRKESPLTVLPLLSSARIHTGNIECLTWLNDHQILSGASEHQIALTNVARMERTDTFLTRDSLVTSLDSTGDKILSAHEDGQLRLWDRRDSSRPAATFKGHSRWASSVRWSSSGSIFASGSYDHTVKVWDTRCVFPLQNLSTPQEKVLGVEWIGEGGLVSGGSDAALHLYTAN